MALSTKTTQKLAIALTPEVIEYIYADERWFDFMIEMVGEAVQQKLGTNDMELIAELGQCVIENMVLKSVTVD
ncbi:hypothetical protein EBR25_11000 [bacterium]|nr:hypothetical protein [bacterium]